MHNQEKDLVSIIIPVYNVAPFLNRCMQSVLGQTYSQLEIILIDDGSTDGSGFMCDEYASKDSRIVVIHQDNRGLSAARNVGTFLSQGKYVCFVDPDDELDAQYIEILHDAMISQDVPLVLCSYISIFERDRICVFGYPCEAAVHSTESIFSITADEYVHNYVERKKTSVTVWNRMYTSELARKVLFPEGRVYEDMATHIQFAVLAEKIAIITQPLYKQHKQRGSSITDAISTQSMKDYLCAYKTVYEHIIAYDSELTDKAKWIVQEAPLSILLTICLDRNSIRDKRIDKVFVQSLRSGVTKSLIHGEYHNFFTCYKALLVLIVPRMLSTLWKMKRRIMFRGKSALETDLK